MHGHHNLYFKLNVHGPLTFLSKAACSLTPQVVDPWLKLLSSDLNGRLSFADLQNVHQSYFHSNL